MSNIPLNDSSHFEKISGLWKGERGPVKPAKVLRSTNFAGDGLFDFGDVVDLDVEARHFAERQLQPGDIIVERSGGGPKQPVGRVSLFIPPDNSPYFSSNFTTTLRIRDRSVFDPQFVALYLHALYLDGATHTLQRATTGLRNLDWREYLRLEVPIRPLPEQEYVVRLVGGVRAAYRNEGALLDVFRSLKRTSLKELFTCGLQEGELVETEFGSVPAKWQSESLNVVAEIQTGIAKGRRLEPSEAIEVPYLRVANVQDGHLDLSEIKTIQIKVSELQRYLLRTGDVVLTEGGDFDKLGRGFIWRGEIPECVHQNHVFAVRLNKEKVLPEFFAYQAQSPYGKAYFLKVAHKTTNLACINTTKLKAFPVLIPELDEQRDIAIVLDAIDRKIMVHQQKRATLEKLFKALLHKLVNGEMLATEMGLAECSDNSSLLAGMTA